MVRDHGRTTAPRIVAIAAVAALAIGVGVLSAIAFGRANPDIAPGEAAPVPTFTLGVQTAAPTATPTPTSTPSSDFDRTTERFLAIGSGTLWRAVAGGCGSAAATIERSNDGGASWSDVTPRYGGIAQVASLDGLTVDAAEAVAGVGAACETQALRTYTNGEFWEHYPDVLAISRFVDLGDPAVVHMTGGPVAAPCGQAHGLRALRQTVALVCDEVAYVWRAGTWAPVAVDRAAAVAITGTDVLVAHSDRGCAGIALTRFAGGDPAAGALAGCAAVTDVDAPLAMVATGDGLRVWSGDEFVTVR